MQNLLIKADSLYGLKYLLDQGYRSKVKLICIDPPYNTGNDSFKYNDRFNHSTWLTFMKNRLEIAKDLLREDGVIFVQIDDNEQAYLKVLMDEIFDRKNFVCNIIIKTSVAGGFKVNGNKPVRVKEFIIKYSKTDSYIYKKTFTLNNREKWDMHNNFYYDRSNNKIFKLEEILIKNNILKENEKLKNIDINNSIFKDFYITHSDNICSTSHYKESQEKTHSLNSKDQVIKYKNNIYLYNGRMLTFLASSLKEVNGKKEFAFAISDLWDDINFNNIQNEVKEISFTNAKKPEALIQRIIEIATTEGDIVLDFFAGSGTTPAVAHKMKRQWIAIEQMDYIQDITKLRLQKVLDGEQGGISKALNWQGGGNFAFIDLTLA